MIPYSAYQPTGFDFKGLALPDRQDWLVAPCGRNRDSGIRTESNWAVQERELTKHDADGETWEIHRFGHWACGWFELVLVKPDTNAARECEALEGALSNYPILDDSDHSEREFNVVLETWDNMSPRERYALCKRLKCHYKPRKRIPTRVFDNLRDNLE